MYDIEKAKKIGERIEEMRKDRDKTQEQLGERCGFTKSKICKLENGIQLPAIDEVFILANALDVEIEYLLGIEKTSAKPLIDNFEKIVLSKTYTTKGRKVYDKNQIPFVIDEDYFVLTCREKIIALFKELASLQADKKSLSEKEYEDRTIKAQQNFAKGKSNKAQLMYLLTDSQLTKIIEKAVLQKNYLKTLLENLDDNEE